MVNNKVKEIVVRNMIILYKFFGLYCIIVRSDIIISIVLGEICMKFVFNIFKNIKKNFMII